MNNVSMKITVERLAMGGRRAIVQVETPTGVGADKYVAAGEDAVVQIAAAIGCEPYVAEAIETAEDVISGRLITPDDEEKIVHARSLVQSCIAQVRGSGPKFSGTLADLETALKQLTAVID